MEQKSKKPGPKVQPESHVAIGGPVPDPSARKSSISEEFHIQEWISLREEIVSQVEHCRNVEMATLVGLGAFYSWFFQNPEPPHSPYLLWIPCFIVAVAGLRSWATLTRIHQIATYLKEIEELLLRKEAAPNYQKWKVKPGSLLLMGWERYLPVRFPRSAPFKYSTIVLWLTCLIVTLGALCLCLCAGASTQGCQ